MCNATSSHLHLMIQELNPLELSLEEGLNLLRLAATTNSRKTKTLSNAQDTKMALDSNHKKGGSKTKIQVNVPRARSAYQFFLKGNHIQHRLFHYRRFTFVIAIISSLPSFGFLCSLFSLRLCAPKSPYACTCILLFRIQRQRTAIQ